jgi:hypothetical protein
LGCFYRFMQAMSDEQQLERLEKKVDDGFAETKAEFRAIRAELRGDVGSVRSEIGSVRSEIGSINRNIHAMWLTMILGFAAILIQNHL